MKKTFLQFLVPGQRFILACDPDVKGTMLRKSDCSVTVKVTGGVRDVEFEDPATGEKRSVKFEGGRTTNWSPNTVVIAGETGLDPEEEPTIKRRRKRAETPEPAPVAAPPRPAATPPGSEAKEPTVTPAPAPEPTKLAESRNAESRKQDQKLPKPTTEGKMSAIDAAEKVLGEEGRALTAKQLVDIMAARGYWSSPGGKTPHATLNSAIMREINTKGESSRFAKHPEGGFTLSIL